jgi:hypothetical protein
MWHVKHLYGLTLVSAQETWSAQVVRREIALDRAWNVQWKGMTHESRYVFPDVRLW